MSASSTDLEIPYGQRDPDPPAVALFVDRARRTRPDFVPTPGDMQSIAAIVRGLDGLPLAIELAAGRLSSLDLGGLQARLDRSLDLLRDGRQVSLRQSIDWSYRLLPAGEKRRLRHLAVFPDGVDLGTAERLAAALDASADPAAAVAHLVDVSMVELAPGAPPRYRMLDTVRSFAQDERLAHGEDHDAGERFRAVLDVARRAITRHSAEFAPPNQGEQKGCPIE